MALVVKDRVKETSTSTGTGTINLAGAATGFQTFVAAIGTTNTTFYAITDDNGSAWEVGIGTVTDASPDTLARTTLLASSTGSKIVLTSGTHTVFATYPAGKAVYLDASGGLSHTVDLTSEVTGTLPVGNGGTGLTSIATLLNSNVTPTTLSLVIGTNVQAYDADLTALAGLSSSDSNFIVGSASGWVAESGATARTSLGVDAAGTDNSTSVTLVTSSHDYLSISTQAITLGTIDISDDTNLAAGTGITLTGDTLSTTDGDIVHDNLSGFVANEHLDWTASVGTIHAGNYTDTVYTLPEANATTKGGIELFSNTDQSVAATAVSATAARTYGLQLNSAGQGVVNIPWVDTNTTYSVGDGGLTTNDFTNDDHSKLNAIAASANNYTLPNASLTVVGGVELATTGETTTGTDATRAATPAGVQAAIDALVGGAPGALDTLNELAAAINDDASYASTITTALALKSTIASPTFTGTVAIPNVANLETAVVANTAKVTNVSTNLATTTSTTTAIITSSDGTDATIPVATTSVGGVMSKAIFDQHTANVAKNTNVSTALSTGTVDATSYGITSDGGSDDIVLAQATTSVAGVLSAAKWDEIVANTAKVTNATHTGDVTGSTALTIATDAVDTAHIADNQVTLGKMAGITRGSIIYGDASGDPAALGIGSNTYVLTSDGTDIAWAAAGGGVSSFNDLNDASFGGTNLTRTILINNVPGGGTYFGVVSDCSDNLGLGYHALRYIAHSTDNIALGYYSSYYLTTGDRNISIGRLALYQNTTGSQNVAIGFEALKHANDGTNNIGIGTDAVRGHTDGTTTTGNHYNTGIGYQALVGITTGDNNVAIGYKAGYALTTESDMLFIANETEAAAGTLIKGDMANKFLAIGNADVTIATADATLQIFPKGTDDTALYVKQIGSTSANLILMEDSTGTDQFVVSSAGAITTGSYTATAIATAYIADDAITGAKIALFDDSLAATTTHFLIADGTDYSSFALSGDVTCTNAGVVSIADNAITLAKLAGGTDGQIITFDASGDPVAVGPGTDGQVLTSTGAGSPPAFEDAGGGGASSLDGLTDVTIVGTRNLFIETDGAAPPHSVTGSGQDNLAIGHDALVNISGGHYNVGIGTNALNAQTASRSVAIGTNAMQYASANYCVAIGHEALMGDSASNSYSQYNTAVGYLTLKASTTGDKNVALGMNAGVSVTSGSSNIFIGNSAGHAHTTDSDTLYIANEAAAYAGTIIKGDMSNKFLAIGSADVTLSTADATLQIFPKGTDDTALYVKQVGSSTGNLILMENSSGTDQFVVSSAGAITTGSYTATAIATAYIADDAITGAKIALFDDSLAATTTHFLIADGTDYSSFALSGDVTCTNAGVVTVATLNQNTTGTAATVTTAAQPNITSVGTLTTLTVDSIIINGTTIGHTSDTDAITIAAEGDVTFSKATKPALKANSDGTTVTFDLNAANVHTVTLGANRTFAISNETAGQKFIIRVLQDGTGSRLVSTWFSTIKWAGGSAPTLTTTAGKADVFGFLVTGTDTYDGFVVGQNI